MKGTFSQACIIQKTHLQDARAHALDCVFVCELDSGYAYKTFVIIETY